MAYKLIDCGDYRKRRSFSRIKKTYELKNYIKNYIKLLIKLKCLKREKVF